jgi:hypothetical protein
VADTALQHNEEEEFQRELLLKGRIHLRGVPDEPGQSKIIRGIQEAKDEVRTDLLGRPVRLRR